MDRKHNVSVHVSLSLRKEGNSGPVAAWMDLEVIVLSETRLSEDRRCAVPLPGGLVPLRSVDTGCGTQAGEGRGCLVVTELQFGEMESSRAGGDGCTTMQMF